MPCRGTHNPKAGGPKGRGAPGELPPQPAAPARGRSHPDGSTAPPRLSAASAAPVPGGSQPQAPILVTPHSTSRPARHLCRRSAGRAARCRLHSTLRPGSALCSPARPPGAGRAPAAPPALPERAAPHTHRGAGAQPRRATAAAPAARPRSAEPGGAENRILRPWRRAAAEARFHQAFRGSARAGAAPPLLPPLPSPPFAV